jgi:hypothetical protein
MASFMRGQSNLPEISSHVVCCKTLLTSTATSSTESE